MADSWEGRFDDAKGRFNSLISHDSRLHESHHSLLSTRILGRKIDVVATALLSGRVSGVGPCRGSWAIVDENVRWEGALQVDGRTKLSVTPSLEIGSMESSLFRKCIPVKFLRICIAAGGSFKMDQQDRFEVKA